jgi:excisionase family DNA binding protein
MVPPSTVRSTAIFGRVLSSVMVPMPLSAKTIVSSPAATTLFWPSCDEDINEVADFLKVDRSTALQLAAEGVRPGAKVGRAWVFLEDEVVNYLRDVMRSQTQGRRAQSKRVALCG